MAYFNYYIKKPIAEMTDEEIQNTIDTLIPYYASHRGELEDHLQYRKVMRSADAQYSANAQARVVVEESEEDTWCEKIEKQAKADAINDRRQKQEELHKYMKTNDGIWQQKYDSAFLHPGRNLYAQPDGEASINFRRAKDINQNKNEDSVDIEPFIKQEHKDPWSICKKCKASLNEITDRYNQNIDTFYGSRDEALLARYRDENNSDRITSYGVAEDYSVKDFYKKEQARLEKKVPELIAEEYVDKIKFCKSVDQNTPLNFDENVNKYAVPVLEVASYVPFVGTPASLALSSIYAANGEITESALAAAGAIPIGGKLIGKGGAKLVSKFAQKELNQIGKMAFEQEARNMARMSEKQVEKILDKTPNLTKEARKKIETEIAKQRKIIANIEEKASSVKKAKEKGSKYGDNVCSLCKP